MRTFILPNLVLGMLATSAAACSSPPPSSESGAAAHSIAQTKATVSGDRQKLTIVSDGVTQVVSADRFTARVERTNLKTGKPETVTAKGLKFGPPDAVAVSSEGNVVSVAVLVGAIGDS